MFYNILPKEKWNKENINLEKDLQLFLHNNIWWVNELICKIFNFSKIDYLGMEYYVFKGWSSKGNMLMDKYDMAFQHGEDIIIVEIKYGYGAQSSAGFKQLEKYTNNFKERFDNKVYRILITDYMTPKILKKWHDFGIILLNSELNPNEHSKKVDFSKTQYGYI